VKTLRLTFFCKHGEDAEPIPLLARDGFVVVGTHNLTRLPPDQTATVLPTPYGTEVTITWMGPLDDQPAHHFTADANWVVTHSEAVNIIPPDADAFLEYYGDLTMREAVAAGLIGCERPAATRPIQVQLA